MGATRRRRVLGWLGGAVAALLAGVKAVKPREVVPFQGSLEVTGIRPSPPRRPHFHDSRNPADWASALDRHPGIGPYLVKGYVQVERLCTDQRCTGLWPWPQASSWASAYVISAIDRARCVVTLALAGPRV